MKVFKSVILLTILCASCAKPGFISSNPSIKLPYQKEDIEFFDRRKETASENRFLRKEEKIAYIEPPLTTLQMDALDKQIKGYLKENGAPIKINYFVEFAYQSYSGYVKEKPYSTGIQIKVELVNTKTNDVISSCITTLLSEENISKSEYEKALSDAYKEVTEQCFLKISKQLKRGLRFS